MESLIGPIMEPFPGLYRILYMSYAPFIEEPAKWSLLLIPWFVRKIDKDSYVRVALAIGLGFGLGELWMLAVELNQLGTVSQYAWYELSGYINERFIVCIMHGGFVALMLRYMRTKIALGMSLAIGLHFVGNFPIYFLRTDFLSLGEDVWMVIVGIWITVFFLGVIIMLAYFAAENRRAGQSLFGLAKCPDCGTIYPRPLLVGVNLVTHRYEPC
ncbi:MAG: hypothetical protein GY771_07240, partial [bacterium]|nr:hypothetical protein [bacterium]